jgi:hypothetical protein
VVLHSTTEEKWKQHIESKSSGRSSCPVKVWSVNPEKEMFWKMQRLYFIITVWGQQFMMMVTLVWSIDVVSLAEKMCVVEEQNVALRSQVQELVEQKLQRDSQLDDFSEALDSRVEEWKVGLKSGWKDQEPKSYNNKRNFYFVEIKISKV